MPLLQGGFFTNLQDRGADTTEKGEREHRSVGGWGGGKKDLIVCGKNILIGQFHENPKP